MCPSRRRMRNASAVLRNFVRHPKTTFSTLSARSSHCQERECDVTIIRGTLPQLKGGDAKYPLQPQRRDRAGIHTRSLENWHEPQVLRQRDRVAVDAGNVEEDLP